MRYFLLVVMLNIFTFVLQAQSSFWPSAGRFEKAPMDTSVFDKWPSVGYGAISNNGNYALFTIYHRQLIGNKSIVVQAIHENWKMELPGVEAALFTNDTRKTVFMNGGDSLGLLSLGSSFIEYIPHVSSYKLFKQHNSEWLAYQVGVPATELRLRNLETGTEQSFSGASEYMLSQDGSFLVVKTESKRDTVVVQSLKRIDLIGGNTKLIWEGMGSDNLVLDDGGNQMAFRVTSNTAYSAEITFWYYKAGTDRAVQLVSNESAGIESGLQLDGILNFSKDGSKLFITIKDKELPKPKPGAIKVDVWSYMDAKLQSLQLGELGPKTYLSVVKPDEGRIIRLQQENDRVNKQADDFICVTNQEGNEILGEYWNSKANPKSYLVLTERGVRKNILFNFISSISPDGKYLIGQENWYCDFYSYDLVKGITRNLTAVLPIPIKKMIERDDDDLPIFLKSRHLLFGGWLSNGDLLLTDEYDIWSIDPSGKRTPINLTNQYGRSHNIVFRLLDIYSQDTISEKKPLVISSFDKINKNTGFYSIATDRHVNPVQLSSGPFDYTPAWDEKSPVKAGNAEGYLIKRGSATRSPNYFWTKNFRSFEPVSTVFPEGEYNWLTSQLFVFTTLDGRKEQAVLYKPENFNPSRKYPIIIYYYERKSQNLNKYHSPDSNDGGGDLDISWFVSNGYVVVTPDIHFKIGETGESALNSIVAVAKYITRYPWVDVKHIGLQGHSFGGYETNYVVTHSSLFAAAVSSSGPTDFISGYNNLLGGGISAQYMYEVWQQRMGVTLWQRPDLYIKNSPIFIVNKITTPLMLIANKDDGNVPFFQNLELFTALRRLGKKGWMLQYDNESHGVSSNGENYKDYIIRMTQFFNHFLKGAPAPKWMVEGIPAKMKGLEDGLELERSGVELGPGLLNVPSWKKLTKNKDVRK